MGLAAAEQSDDAEWLQAEAEAEMRRFETINAQLDDLEVQYDHRHHRA